MTGYGGGHAPGTGRRGATEFPSTWSREQITERLLDVARYPDETPRRLANGLWHTTGVREGVRIVVLLEPAGGVRTAFPIDGPGVVRNPDRATDPDRPTLDDLAAGRASYESSERLASVSGQLDDTDRQFYAQLHRAGEWDELEALLTAQFGAPAP